MKTTRIDKEDVIGIADFLGVQLSEDQINEILENYDSVAQDKTETWDLIVEQMIDEIPGEEFEFYLDEKITCWMRTTFKVKGEDKEDAKKKAIEFYKSGGCDGIKWEKVDETNEEMSVEDNDGQTTEELFTIDGETIFDNAKDK
jgi:hypothetical protein